ncbi:MAG: aspartate/glutamate racemase family protein [Phycisphaerales bacterium]|nr:MAG: aspartate/glutamate racemase family protein [Phycisphaerales bacterium]
MSHLPFGVDPIRLFGDYMKVTGVPTPAPEEGPDPGLAGKKLGVVNGASWISLWSTYFGKTLLPGVKIINAGNEAVQLNFMEAHNKGLDCPPRINIDLFCKYARDLYDLHKVDAVMISCSTMNRAFRQVSETMKPLGVPVIQIDEAMMEQAVSTEGRILIVATHGPTVKSTRALLQETADQFGRRVDYVGATIEEAFELLGQGKIAEHNQAIAETIRKVRSRDQVDVVVLAQLSMSVFSFSFPEPVQEFGIPVLNSGQTGFARAGEILRRQ